MELAENNGKNKDNQDSDDQNSDNPVSSHPDCASLETVENWGKRRLPARHAPQCLHAAVNIAFPLPQIITDPLKRLPLNEEILQSRPADVFGFIGDHLTLLQPSSAPPQTLSSRQKLLPLLHVLIHRGLRVVGVAISKRGSALVLKRTKLAFYGINVCKEIAEPSIDPGSGCSRDVFLLQAHLIELTLRLSA